MPPPANDSSSTTVESMLGGSHQPVAVSANSLYKINPEIDAFYKISANSSLYGGSMTDAENNGWSTGTASMAASNLNLGTSDVTVEFFAILKPTASRVNLFFIGQAGASTIRIEYKESGGVVRFATNITDTAGTLIGMSTSLQSMTGIAGSTTIRRHVVIDISRSTGKVKYHVDGTLLATETYIDTGTSVDITAITSGRAGLGISNAGAEIGVDATVHSLKVYDISLSLSQITARTDAGPLGQPADTGLANLNYWVNFQNGTGLYHPDTNYGNLAYTAFSAPTVALVSTGSAATPSDSDVVWAKDPVIVATGVATYINLYTRSGNTGDVALTKL